MPIPIYCRSFAHRGLWMDKGVVGIRTRGFPGEHMADLHRSITESVPLQFLRCTEVSDRLWSCRVEQPWLDKNCVIPMYLSRKHLAPDMNV